MSGLVPIPNTRISGLLARQRLIGQFQADQLDLFRLQDQISTGQRIILPSDDAPAALRAISLQRLIERKEQLEVNIRTGQSFLSATDTALSDVSTLLADIKGAALGVAGTTNSQEERDAVLAGVNRTIEQLVDTGNRNFRGRFLFTGSQTNVKPYSFDGASVSYAGNDRSVQSFLDIGVLLSSNAPGTDVFGGISQALTGSADLNPQLNADTLLSSLRGGRGISPNGALTISDGTNISIVDISSAATVGDIARFIEANPPAGRTITATITGQGLTLQLTDGALGNLTVREVSSGTAARELGILEETGVSTSPLVGSDLDPIVLKTTRIDDLLGTKARVLIPSVGNNNDITIEATANGTDFDGVTVTIVDGGNIGAAATVAFDGLAKTLTISVDDSGETTANNVLNAINAEGTFTAYLDAQDTSSLVNAGTGTVSLATAGTPVTTSGGSGTSLDRSSGIRVVNGDETFDITFENAETVEDLINTILASGAGLVARINDAGTGIDVHSRLSGSPFQIGELGGQTASQLGIRTFTGETKLAGLNSGIGVPTQEGFQLPTTTGTDLTLTASDGQQFSIDLTGAESLADVVIEINNVTGGVVTAQLASPGNVVELVDSTFPDAGQLTVAQATGSLAAQYLGLVPNGASLSTSTTDTLTGSSERYIDFTITSASGQTFGIDLSSASTVGDAIDAINAITTTNVTAQLASNGNGIELVDNTTGSSGLTVTADESSQAAEFLGLIPLGSNTSTTTTGTLTGEDRNFLETESAFTTLIQLRDALQAGDIPAIERALAKIDTDIDRVNFARAEVGARGQGLEIAQRNLEDEDIQLRSALSDELDVDLVEAISNLTARQVAMEASLRSTASILQLSLFSFL